MDGVGGLNKSGEGLVGCFLFLFFFLGGRCSQVQRCRVSVAHAGYKALAVSKRTGHTTFAQLVECDEGVSHEARRDAAPVAYSGEPCIHAWMPEYEYRQPTDRLAQLGIDECVHVGKRGCGLPCLHEIL